MGTLYYAADAHGIDIDDALLAHLKAIISTKLRRNESFTLTLRHAESDAGGRTSLWLQPAIPLRFAFESAEATVLDRSILAELAVAANTTAGVVVDLEADLPLVSLSSRQASRSAA